MEYNFKEIEAKWQSRWRADKTYKVETDPSRPKFYVLDMFPYPSGAGLHVGHPLGYIASDIYSRYKRLKGFNVLHPMGYDAFGLPAEQYAIQTGQHPAVTTEQNIARYREQLDKIGFSFDWDREVRTCDPGYYKWTQWAFLEMFSHWYDRSKQQARPVAELTAAFETSGTEGLDAACTTEMHFTAAEWNAKSEREKEQILQNYRLAFRADTQVNWCPKLGTVLANDEVHDGLSVRGGYPVEQKRMKQWLLRVTAYAQRMLDGLDKLEWSDSLKEIQRNWIGRSEGAQVFFDIENSDRKLEIFTTRPDTIFGVTFMVIAPEHEWVGELTTPENKAAVEEYIRQTKKRSERDRIADTKRMYEMFLGPLEQSKPWDTNGIDGVHKFLRRFWRLFFDRDGQLCVTDEKATEQELRTLHKTIKKVSEDIENFSFNTSVAAFMICLNELGECSKREVLEPLTVLLAPFAPHIAEELWAALGHTESVCTASYPVCDETHLVRNSFEYPVSVNGKLRFRKEYAASMTPAEIQADVVTAPEAQKWLEGKTPKKIIVVPGKIINIVI